MAEFGDEKGLSLLEVMVAMFMVALISSSLMGGFIISNKMLKLAEQETRASSYAYAILEDLRARSEDNKWEKLEYYCVLRIDLGYNIIKQRC